MLASNRLNLFLPKVFVALIPNSTQYSPRHNAKLPMPVWFSHWLPLSFSQQIIKTLSFILVNHCYLLAQLALLKSSLISWACTSDSFLNRDYTVWKCQKTKWSSIIVYQIVIRSSSCWFIHSWCWQKQFATRSLHQTSYTSER